MSTPTVNVVMTYNPAKMLKFQETGSLEVFKKFGDTDVQIFSNSPNSNFISLTHDLGYDSGGGEEGAYPRVEIEFIDPKGIFDYKLNFNQHTLLDPNDDLVAIALEKKREEMDVFQEAIHEYEQWRIWENHADLADEWDAKYASGDQDALDRWDPNTRHFTNKNDEIQFELEQWAKKEKQMGVFGKHLENPVEGFSELIGNAVDLGWVNQKIEDLTNEIKDLEEYDGKKEVALIQKQIEAYNSTLRQSIFITYGIGDDLKDWCPPMCFSQVTMVEFSFDATKGRTMKLIYGGQGEQHPTLTSMGILPLGSLGLGAVFNGTSRRLFSREAAQTLNDDYGDPAGKDVSKPSLHKIITDTLRSFLQTSTNSSNVMVLFPNLDKLLAKYYKQEWEAVKSSNADVYYTNDAEKLLGWKVWHIEATREVLEGLGFTMSCSRNSYKGRMGDLIFNELERQVDDIAVSNWVLGTKAGTPASPDSVIAWLEDRDFRCELSTNGLYETVKEKLESFKNHLQEAITQTTDEAPPFNVGWYYETDYQILRILEGYGLIKDRHKPALIFGDLQTIRMVLNGVYFEDPSLTAGESAVAESEWTAGTPGVTGDVLIEEKLKSVLSFFDIEDGYCFNLIKDLYEVENPIPWLGPFGPTANESMENFLPEDTNINSMEYEALKQSQSYKFSRMPVFSFGTKNPNILNFDMDINKQYTKLLNTFNYINMPAFGVTTAILGKNTKEAQDACDLLSKVIEFQKVSFKGPVNKSGIPVEFAKIVTNYWKPKERSGARGLWHPEGTITNFGDWEEVFAILAPNYTLDREFSNLDDFIYFLWSAFCSLTQGDVPRSSLRIRGVNPINQMLNKHIDIGEKMSGFSYLGTIKTIPMFHLSNARRASQGRQAVVLGIEPKFIGTDGNSVPPTSTWFSGLYNINGFKHTITKSAVHSEFAVVKPLSTGGFVS